MQDTFWTTELVNEYAGTFLLQAMKAIEAARNGSPVEKIISASEFIASKSPKKEPVLVTVDGIARLNGEAIFIVGKDFQHYAEPDAANDFTKGYYSSQYIFSTKEAADKFIAENKPLLSLNDVKRIPDYDDHNDLIAQLTALVKQKLNQ